MTVLNSTSVLVGWERVPKEYRNGIITKYTIYYRDELKKAEGTKVVIPPNKTVIINGLRQKAEYLFWILAATSKANGPPGNTIKATTDGKDISKCYSSILNHEQSVFIFFFSWIGSFKELYIGYDGITLMANDRRQFVPND